MENAERLLPHDVLARASLRGGEYAWPLGDIPDVIQAAKAANLMSIGGQLQFRFPNGKTCECYWIEVYSYVKYDLEHTWNMRVARSAELALSNVEELCKRFDFVKEGRLAFTEHLDEFESGGGDLADILCFVWYVTTEAYAANFLEE